MSKTKTQASQMVRGAGMAADVWRKLDEAVKARGGSDDDLHRLARPEGDDVIGMFADHLVKLGAAQRNTYPVTVDYGRSLKSMIEDGKYDYVNEHIKPANFPVTGEGESKVEIILHFPNRVTRSEEVIKELDKLGLRQANLPELCAFGAAYPDVQREFPIICLGSTWVGPGGDRLVPYLVRWHAGRRLYLGWFGAEWDDYCRFAAVRKS